MNDTFLYTLFFVSIRRLCIHAEDDGVYHRGFNNTPIKSYGDAMRPYKIPAPHPEMEGVKYGEELLVFSAEEEDDDDDGDVPAYVGENI